MLSTRAQIAEKYMSIGIAIIIILLIIFIISRVLFG